MVLVAPVRLVYPAFGFVFWPVIAVLVLVGFCFGSAFPIAVIVAVLIGFCSGPVAGFRFSPVGSI